MKFWWTPIPLGTAMWFVTSFLTTLTFYTFSFDFSIKSYDRLKLFHVNFCQLQIYHSFLQCQDSSIKYSLNEVHTNPKLLTNEHIDACNAFNVYKYYLIHYKIKSKLSRIGHPRTQNQHVRCIHKFIKKKSRILK